MSKGNIAYRFKRLKYINKRFGRLVVLDYYPGRREGNKTFPSKIKYICDCGTIKTVHFNSKKLEKNKTASCGCYHKELRKKHGGAGTPEYKSWTAMRNRCLNPESDFYHRYGGRGIKICERWNHFSNFLEDMGQRPSLNHSIDRINNDGNYEISNCRWATNSEQQLNKNIVRASIDCAWCGKNFSYSLSQNRKYCSTLCSDKGRKENPSRTCEYCKKTFYPDAKSDPPRHCSVSCGAKNRRKK